MLTIANVEHIGIAVRDMAVSNDLFAKLLNVQPYKTETVASEGVNDVVF